MISGGTAVSYDPLTFYEDPHPIYRDLRDAAPVYRNDERDLWVLSRYADVQAAGRDWETFANGRGVDIDVEDFTFGPGDLLNMDPPRHDELRRILRGTFTPRSVKALEPAIRQKVDELLDALIERGGGDFAHDFARRLPFTVICELWGVPSSDHGLLEDWFVRMVERDPGEMAVQDDALGGRRRDERLPQRGRRRAPRRAARRPPEHDRRGNRRRPDDRGGDRRDDADPARGRDPHDRDADRQLASSPRADARRAAGARRRTPA